MASTVVGVSQNQFAVAADNDVITIGPGVSVYDSADALYNSHSGVTLINYGGALSSVDSGVFYDFGSGGFIVNEASGCISGSDGIFTDSNNGVSIINFGSITGTSAVNNAIEIGTNASFVDLDNRGMIFGLGVGVQIHSDSGEVFIKNSGTIEAFTNGIEISTGIAGAVTTIVNSGTIKGGFSISIMAGHLGAVNLTNTGHLIGDVSLESSAAGDSDTIVNTGSIPGFIFLGAGNDLFNGTGGTSGAIFGQAGTDRLIAGRSNDIISGGPGNDTLTGGPGKDQFLFDAALNASTNVDRIKDITHLVDKIDLSHAIFPAAGSVGHLAAGAFFEGGAAHDANDRIVYNPANGFLTYDSNGSAAGGVHHFATLALHLTLTNADFLVVV